MHKGTYLLILIDEILIDEDSTIESTKMMGGGMASTLGCPDIVN